MTRSIGACAARGSPTSSRRSWRCASRHLARADHADHPGPQRLPRRAPGPDRLDRLDPRPGDTVARQPLLPGLPDARRPADPSETLRRAAAIGHDAGWSTSTSGTPRSSGSRTPVRRLRSATHRAAGYRVWTYLADDGTCPCCGRPLAGLWLGRPRPGPGAGPVGRRRDDGPAAGEIPTTSSIRSRAVRSTPAGRLAWLVDRPARRARRERRDLPAPSG